MGSEATSNANAPNSLPPLRLEYRHPDELADNPENWRRHPEEQRVGLFAQMRELKRLDTEGDTSGWWGGVVLYNERTGRLINGHLRKETPDDLLVDGKIPVVIGRWTEEQERLLLGTLDPLAEMAETDGEALRRLILAIETEDEEVRGLFDSVARGDDLPDFGGIDPIEEMPDTHPDGGAACVMTFAVLPGQRDVILSALELAKASGPFDGDNLNSNGNALHRLAVSYGNGEAG